MNFIKILSTTIQNINVLVNNKFQLSQVFLSFQVTQSFSRVRVKFQFLEKLDLEKEKKVEQFLRSDAGVIWTGKTIGKYNLLMYIAAKTTNELHNTINKLRDAFPLDVEEYENLVMYKRHKYTYFPEGLSKNTRTK